MMDKIRNFAIIAHIDHGKSTVSDRIIEYCGNVEERNMESQILDSMDIEKERGITIKSQTVRLKHTYNNEVYSFNLMDTPGHVDFSYEVSRCLKACEGAILLVDATQGVEAQTLANAYKAIDADLEIIPVFNKIDLPSANLEDCKRQVEDVLGIETDNALCVSGKTGEGIPALLDAIAQRVPAPKGDPEKPLKAMMVDAWYDKYAGVISLVRIIDGKISKGDSIKSLFSQKEYGAEEVGIFKPKRESLAEGLSAGEVGYICANIKSVKDCYIGDTFVQSKDTTTKPLEGFKQIKPVVFCGIFPVDSSEYQELKQAIEKLTLNDSSIEYDYESSNALGFGFRCGFLGLLHMEVTQERLEREFNLNIIVTAPSVSYNVITNQGEEITVNKPDDMPDMINVSYVEEPMAEVNIIVPSEYLGDVIKLTIGKRGVQKNLQCNQSNRTVYDCVIPMSEIVIDFHDRLKSISRGYASFEWEPLPMERSDIVLVEIIINNERVHAFSFMTHRSTAEHRGRAICLKLKKLLPRQMFAIPIQAAIGGKIIARETISAYRKDVTAKCYGGDISRKRKLLEKQKKGKKKMKMIGSVEVPQSAFMAIMKSDDNNK